MTAAMAGGLCAAGGPAGLLAAAGDAPSLLAEVWPELLGRSHPVVLHLPFGLLAALVLLELWSLVRRRRLEPGTRQLLSGVTAASALLAATSGWLLAREPAYGGETLELHRVLGSITAGLALLTSVAAWRGMHAVYGAALAATLLVLLPTGHLGGSMTHGDGFLLEPLRAAEERAAQVAAGTPLADDAAAEPAAADGALSGPALIHVDAPVVVSTTAPGAPRSDPSWSTPPDAASGAEGVPASSWYASRILPLFEQRCTNCHGTGKRKGGLALHSFEALLEGSEDGPVVVAGDAAHSLLVQRLRLPLDDEDHMPPASKGQPSPQDIAEIEAWIAAGASAELPLPTPAAGGSESAEPPTEPPTEAPTEAPTEEPTEEPASTPVGSSSEEAPAESDAAEPLQAAAGREGGAAAAPAATDEDPRADFVRGLRAELLHVEVIDPASGGLLLDASARPAAGGVELARWLPGVADVLVELSLAGTRVDDAALAQLPALPWLEALDLSRTAVGSGGLAALRPCERLATLNLTGTAVDDAALELLAELPALRRLDLWDTAVSPEGRARLLARRPELRIEDGADILAEALEAEPAFAFGACEGGVAAAGVEDGSGNVVGNVAGNVVGNVAESAADTLAETVAGAVAETATALNTRCPVSGNPVAAGIVRQHEGATIGFCCEQCPARFLADPAAFPARD